MISGEQLFCRRGGFILSDGCLRSGGQLSSGLRVDVAMFWLQGNVWALGSVRGIWCSNVVRCTIVLKAGSVEMRGMRVVGGSRDVCVVHNGIRARLVQRTSRHGGLMV